MRLLAAIAAMMLVASCVTDRVDVDFGENVVWADRCDKVTGLASAPLDGSGFRFVHFFWPGPDSDSIALYASMRSDPNDDHSWDFYTGGDAGGAGQITHYLWLPEVGALFADCLKASGRFMKISRADTTGENDFLTAFSAVYADRHSKRMVVIETLRETLGVLVSDRLKGGELQAKLRARMGEMFEDDAKK